MGKKIAFLIILFSFLAPFIFAKGKSQEEIKTQNDEWLLCVTEFDIKSIPEDKQTIAGVITKNLVERLKIVNYRTRVSNEYAYYEEYAWAAARGTAAKSLANKMNDRSMLLYSGDPVWKYKRNLKKLDTEIETLQTALEEIDSKAPLINKEPVFSLAKGNIDGDFPAAPKAGNEYKFCSNQKIDAFLTGTVREFHGRFYVSVKMFTLFTNSYAYQDNIIFSPEDMDSAISDFTRNLIMTLSGNSNAVITVRAQPDDALILINKSFAGRGEVPPLEYPQGNISVTVSAADYESINVETELISGQITEIDIELTPVNYTDVEITGFPENGSVYHGALYLGEAPLTLRLPVNTLDYIELETQDDRKGQVIFFTPPDTNYKNTVSIKTNIIPKKGRVDKARRTYYWAWAGTWVTGIAAWLSYYTYTNHNNIISPYTEDERREKFSQKYADDNLNMYYISMGAFIALGAAVLHEIFQIGRYVYISDKGSTPVIKIKQVKKEPPQSLNDEDSPAGNSE